MSDFEPGRRQRKKQATRDDLMDHAARLFDERGFDAVTTTDIAEAADVSQRTFFRHFPSKEAVLYGHADVLRRRLLDEFANRPGQESVVDSVIAAVRAMGGYYETHHDETFLQARLAADFPRERAGLDRFFRLLHDVDTTLRLAPRVKGAGDLFTVLRSAPGLLRWSRATLKELLDHHFDDPRLKAAVAGPCGDLGLPPSRLSAAPSSSPGFRQRMS